MLQLTGDQAADVFGVTKTKGGSYSGFYGSTTWCITGMTVTPPVGSGKAELRWTLSGSAKF